MIASISRLHGEEHFMLVESAHRALQFGIFSAQNDKSQLAIFPCQTSSVNIIIYITEISSGQLFHTCYWSDSSLDWKIAEDRCYGLLTLMTHREQFPFFRVFFDGNSIGEWPILLTLVIIEWCSRLNVVYWFSCLQLITKAKNNAYMVFLSVSTMFSDVRKDSVSTEMIFCPAINTILLDVFYTYGEWRRFLLSETSDIPKKIIYLKKPYNLMIGLSKNEQKLCHSRTARHG